MLATVRFGFGRIWKPGQRSLTRFGHVRLCSVRSVCLVVFGQSGVRSVRSVRSPFGYTYYDPVRSPFGGVRLVRCSVSFLFGPCSMRSVCSVRSVSVRFVFGCIYYILRNSQHVAAVRADTSRHLRPAWAARSTWFSPHRFVAVCLANPVIISILSSRLTLLPLLLPTASVERSLVAVLTGWLDIGDPGPPEVNEGPLLDLMHSPAKP